VPLLRTYILRGQDVNMYCVMFLCLFVRAYSTIMESAETSNSGCSFTVILKQLSSPVIWWLLMKQTNKQIVIHRCHWLNEYPHSFDQFSCTAFYIPARQLPVSLRRSFSFGCQEFYRQVLDLITSTTWHHVGMWETKNLVEILPSCSGNVRA